MKRLFSLILILPILSFAGSSSSGGGVTMVAGGSDVEVEDETGYGDYRISLADGQSWFGGDVLGSDLFDAGAGTFDSGTYSWSAYWTNTIANVSNALEITYVDTAGGANLILKDAADLSSDLTAGQLYKLQLDAKINTGSANISLTLGSLNTYDAVTNTTLQTFVIYFVAYSADADRLRLSNMSAGEVITLDNITIQAVTSPADYADTGALIRVCDSGGTTATDCATGYLGSAEAGETRTALPNNITGITKANPGVVSSTSHALVVNQQVYFYGLTEMTELNDTYKVITAVGGANSFSINDTSGYGAAETTGGATGWEITAAWPNSVTIYKEPHLATEGWLSIGATFDPNDISTWEIYQ